MLIQFSVQNFKSIKDKVTLSFEASIDSTLSNNVATLRIPYTERILKSILIFGANASGKSNIFSALRTAILTIRNSNSIPPGFQNSHIVPFKFSNESDNAPTSFEFVFVIDNHKYVYRFSTTSKEIVNEELYVYFTAKPTTIFKRKNNKYNISSSYEKLKALTKRTTDNKLFLATASSWNCKETMTPFSWFMNKINTYSNDYINSSTSYEKFENDNDGCLKDFTINLLHRADINIADYQMQISQIVNKIGMPNISSDSITSKPIKIFEIKTKHNINDDGQDKEFELNFLDESLGTQNLFFLSPILKDAFENGELICIDELDSSLHPLLVEYIVCLFNNPNINKNNAQLVASIHTTELLNLDKFRRDQFYFTNKNRQTAVTELYSLDEFSVRKKEKIKKEYLLGRYDAIPNILPLED